VGIDNGTDDGCFQVAIVGFVVFAQEVLPGGPKTWRQVLVGGGNELEARVPKMAKVGIARRGN